MSEEIKSRPYRPEQACERCVFGSGEHAAWCPMNENVKRVAERLRQAMDELTAHERQNGAATLAKQTALGNIESIMRDQYAMQREMAEWWLARPTPYWVGGQGSDDTLQRTSIHPVPQSQTPTDPAPSSERTPSVSAEKK